MTKNEARAAIRAISPALTLRKISDTGEYRLSYGIPAIQYANNITYNEAKERNEAVAVYSSDLEDIVGTAKAMDAQVRETGRI